jgi:cell volume regulation protein A
LIVRDVDESGKVLAIGVSLEPTPTPASIPAFLAPGEMWDRLKALVARGRPAAPVSGTESER